MEKEELVQAVEALLFASGKGVSADTLSEILGVEKNDVTNALEELRKNLLERSSGIQLIKTNSIYQLATLEKFYSYICTLLDKRPKPTLSQAALEVLSIIAYNPGITRAEVEKIRGVSSDSGLNKLLEYNLIEDAGRLNAPGRPVMYKTSAEFLKMFGYTSVDELPKLPKFEEIFKDEESNELAESENVETNLKEE